MRRARGLPRSIWGTAFAHAGVGVALIGIVCETTWNSEFIGTMKPNDVTKLAGYELKLDGLTQRQGPNYREMVASFDVSSGGRKISVMTPSKRNFTARGSSTTEAALLARGVPVVFDMHDEHQLQEFKGSGVLDIPGLLQGNGHAMTVVGYDDARRAFRIQNSWGKEWGEGGYGWFGYDFWTRNALAGFVID